MACAIRDAYENGGFVSRDEYSEESNSSGGWLDSSLLIDAWLDAEDELRCWFTPEVVDDDPFVL